LELPYGALFIYLFRLNKLRSLSYIIH
jgi:hypothetical protein